MASSIKAGVLQFFPTAEGYVNRTGNTYNYVYNYTDHLGNVRVSYAKDPVSGLTKIVEENNYYPFGLKHANYNSYVPVNTYNYKYQGQERQDELGLNWDSFKWRNYDYAIGRFMSVDPLAEKYAYNSPYAFQENKMGLGRELEGLEMVSERSKDGKSVTLTLKVNAVNKSLNINDAQYKTILAARIKNTEGALSGSIGGGVTVNAKVVVDTKATIKMEFNDAIDPKGVKSIENSKSPEKVQNSVDSALGVASEIGNTQVNKVQVNVPRNLEFDNAGIPIIDAKNLNYISNTGTHEDLHAAGLEHVEDAKNRMNYENASGTKLTEEQRKIIINNVEKQQTQ